MYVLRKVYIFILYITHMLLNLMYALIKVYTFILYVGTSYKYII
jgi:hypothetical protein